MARTKKPVPKNTVNPNAEISGAGTVLDQRITDTLRENYMPYAMSVIASRAIPEIDGLKPSHRKLLYTMYKMGLSEGGFVKSANIVGQTMRYNPHGDAGIYETMVRLTRACESLLHPLVESKGSFGKAYSRDMKYAAARYTEAKLAKITSEFFRDINRDAVDFIPNYDNTTTEPRLLPVTFPAILCNPTVGIAVGMASNIPSFNLAEIVDATIELLENEEFDVASVLKAPDFPGGGRLLYNAEEMRKCVENGGGSFKIRSVWNYDKSGNRIEITQIPPTTTVEAIKDKIIDIIKGGGLKEIRDIRDETDINGLRLTIDLRGNADPDKLMERLFASTPLQDTFSANINVLIEGSPRVLGVRELLLEWIAFRIECVKRRVYFDRQKLSDRLHLLEGLELILLDIDKAIRIVRDTAEEAEVVPNLMIGFGIDETQAEYVAEIKLRHLNREYILKRTKEISDLKVEVKRLGEILKSHEKQRAVIRGELLEVKAKYGMPRKTEIIYNFEEPTVASADEPDDYPVTVFMTAEGYFKKVTPLSLRMSGEHKFKEGDSIAQTAEITNCPDLLFFTDPHQVYKTKAYNFADTKISLLGDFLPVKLGMDEDELPVYMVATKDYSGSLLFFFENGKCARVAVKSYETKTNRKKLISAYSDKSPLVAVFTEEGKPLLLLLNSTNGKLLLIDAAQVPLKTSKDTIGVAVMTMKPQHKVAGVRVYTDGMLSSPHRYRVKNLPAAGARAAEGDELNKQLSIF